MEKNNRGAMRATLEKLMAAEAQALRRLNQRDSELEE
jgi:hypothetical protein